jgi:hypothetical protein
LVCVIVIFLGVVALSLSAQTQSPSLFAANVIREALKENGVLPKMTSIQRTSGEMRRLVAQGLDRRLLSHLKSISGRDFQYQLSDSGKIRDINVIVLEYSTPAEAKQMGAILGPRGDFHLAALTPYSAVPLGSLLVVTSTEGTYNRIYEAVINLGSDFAKASESGAISWAEPGTVNAPK